MHKTLRHTYDEFPDIIPGMCAGVTNEERILAKAIAPPVRTDR